MDWGSRWPAGGSSRLGHAFSRGLQPPKRQYSVKVLARIYAILRIPVRAGLATAEPPPYPISLLFTLPQPHHPRHVPLPHPAQPLQLAGRSLAQVDLALGPLPIHDRRDAHAH